MDRAAAIEAILDAAGDRDAERGDVLAPLLVLGVSIDDLRAYTFVGELTDAARIARVGE